MGVDMRLYDQNVALTLDYKVMFSRGIFASDDSAFLDLFGDEHRRVLVFVDDQVAATWPTLRDEIQVWAKRNSRIVDLCGVQTVPGGEPVKNSMQTFNSVASLAREHGICRHSYIIAIGGGAVLDAIGFAASVVHRGIRLIRMPTTVLSMNDSGVGVKNGINYAGSKNFLGVFAPAHAVVCDLDFLSTLDHRTWSSGIAEAFKVAAIKDGEFLEWLISHSKELAAREPGAEEHMIVRTAELHMDHISQGGDPFERGSSRPLDFGHWAAHRLETMTDFELLHGEAVSIGIALDLAYAVRLELLSEADAKRVVIAMRDVGMPVTHAFLTERFDQVLVGLEEFREHLGGNLTIAMPSPLGQQVDIFEIDSAQMTASVADVQAWVADSEVRNRG
ncbi:MAG: 3-dehydroquinate synthase [Rhodothermales bacterium]|jgi:3-dehydroquinate synthase